MTEPVATDADAPDFAKADVGIVCGLPIELRLFLKNCERLRSYEGGEFTFRGGRYDGVRVAVVEATRHAEKARRATLALLEAHRPEWLLSVGLCSGLTDEVRVGRVVVADRLVRADGTSIDLETGMQSDLQHGLHVGTVAEADIPVRLIKEKQVITEATGAIAADSKSLACAEICRDQNVKFLSVLAVSDDLSEDLPPEILSVYADTGSARFGAAIGSILKRPSSVKGMWHLRENAWKAADNLATFLDGVVVQLGRSISD